MLRAETLKAILSEQALPVDGPAQRAYSQSSSSPPWVGPFSWQGPRRGSLSWPTAWLKIRKSAVLNCDESCDAGGLEKARVKSWISCRRPPRSSCPSIRSQPDIVANPHPFYHRLRETDPVHHSPLGLYVASRRAEASPVLRDKRFGKDYVGRMTRRHGDRVLEEPIYCSRTHPRTSG